jgi:hypothetical protein
MTFRQTTRNTRYFSALPPLGRRHVLTPPSLYIHRLGPYTPVYRLRNLDRCLLPRQRERIVTYTTKDGAAHEVNALEFLAQLSCHISKTYESSTRYYGRYSSRRRGERAKLFPPLDPLSLVHPRFSYIPSPSPLTFSPTLFLRDREVSERGRGEETLDAKTQLVCS